MRDKCVECAGMVLDIVLELSNLSCILGFGSRHGGTFPTSGTGCSIAALVAACGASRRWGWSCWRGILQLFNLLQDIRNLLQDRVTTSNLVLGQAT